MKNVLTRKQIEKWKNLDEFLMSDIGKNQTRIPVVFCAPKGYADSYPWKTGEDCLYLGDVFGMAGHGVFVSRKTGITHWGYHNDSFYIPDYTLEDFKDQNERQVKATEVQDDVVS